MSTVIQIVGDNTTVFETTDDQAIVSSQVTGLQGAQGIQGATGATGATGAQGSSGVVNVTSPITNSGTSTSAQLGFDVTNFPRNLQRKFISGRYYYPSNALTRANTPLPLGSAYFAPFEVPTDTTFDQMSMAVLTGVTSATVRLGIYNADLATLTPSSLVLDAGTVSAATSASYPTITINQTLTAGLYFLVMVVQGAGPVPLWYFTSSPYLNYTTLPTTGSGVGGSYVQTSVTGSLPSSASVSTSSIQIVCPGIAIRAA